MLLNLYPHSKKLKSSLYRLAYSGETFQKVVMCSLPLSHVPIPALSSLPSSPVLPCSNRNKGIRFPVVFPSCAQALVRSCCITKKAWPVKEEAVWTTISKPKACKFYSKIHSKYCWMHGLPRGSFPDLEKTCHKPSIRSPWPDGELKRPCFFISINSAVTQGLKIPKGWKLLGTQLFLSFGGTWALEI